VTETLDRETLPASVKLAAGLFMGYGVMTFINTTAVLAGAGLAAPRGWLHGRGWRGIGNARRTHAPIVAESPPV